ncbi:hypothetical protein GQ44DRAFT_811759 [Phaeosphaeriaceae sp. PMI808]|nr:hypothetical protein GQ44DRAFT_811759 [Phaeosphaeriaceae sp. PMI808]
MFSHLFLASLGVLVAANEPSWPKTFDCSTDTAHASDDFMNTIASLRGKPNAGSHAARAALAAQDTSTGPMTVDVVFHIVSKVDKKSTITNEMLSAQLDILNQAYQPYDINFNLINVTWCLNDAWAGSYKTLNIYFQTDLAGGVLGRCTIPSSIESDNASPSDYYNDRCNVNASTMPEGSMNGYNKGKTTAHETGHWLGLLHAFEDYSFDGPGDFIDDTPVEKTATDWCPTEPAKRSCPDKQKVGETDPIHNYMDYSVDASYGGFTALQVVRMKNMWGMFRNGN